MAHETVTKSKRFYCVSLIPDFCKTPVGNSVVVIPYNIKGEFITSQAVSKSVKTHSEPVFLHNRSYIPSVTGDSLGKLGGVKSGTFLKRVESNQFSSTKGSNGTQTIQESRFVWMNNKNTYGRVLETQGQAPRGRLTILGWEVPTAKEAAQAYRDKYSESLHQFGGDAMDVGGKIGKGSAVLGVAGAGVAATGVGLPAAAAMEVGAAAGGITAGAVGGTGLVVDSVATVGDMAADYFIDGKVPDAVGAAGDMALNAAENMLFKKIPGGGKLFDRLFKKKNVPGKTPELPKKPAPDKGKGDDGTDGGKVKQEKPAKKDKPSACCPKSGAPGNKGVHTPKPVHIGTGEEILSQVDFVLEGPTRLSWERTYRSGSETEDWGAFGARWGTEFTSAVSTCQHGIVYHDATGRAVRLPNLGIGAAYDCRAEGFTLHYDHERQLRLLWRDGTVDTFHLAGSGCLPHGYEGVNAVMKPRALTPTRRYALARRAYAGGKGYTVVQVADAAPGEVLFRIATDDGAVLEALRADWLPGELDRENVPARIGRVEQVLGDGTRLAHVTYRFEFNPDRVASDGSERAFDRLPQRCLLVAQAGITGDTRRYQYEHCLLTAYTNYAGFVQQLEWISLEALQDRWGGRALGDHELARRYPLSLDNSYRARVTRTVGADGSGETRLAYLNSDTTRLTEAGGGVLEYTFNASWLATDVRRLEADGRLRSLGRREWDSDGMLLTEVDGAGNATRYTYDLAGNLTSITDARLNSTRISYTANNQQASFTDALGHTSRRAYDDAGRLSEKRNALGHGTTFGYDADGRLIAITDARGGVSRVGYDTVGRVAAHTDCSGFTRRYAYDGLNRLNATTDAAGNTKQYRYDALGRVSELIHPGGVVELFLHDASGNLVEHTDPAGRVTRYRYNGYGLPVVRTDANGQELRYQYDEALRLVALINAKGERYQLTYDLEHRLTSEIGFDGKITKYVYDGAGQLVASEFNGVRTDFARDSLGQLQAKVGVDGSTRYAYDALGQLTAVSVACSEHRFTYDAVGQLLDERAAYSLGELGGAAGIAPTAAFALSHAYDELGNRIRTTMPNGRILDTQRYGAGHWHGMLWQGESFIDVERDKSHREVRRDFGSAQLHLQERRAYDPQSRLSSLTLAQGNKNLRMRRYTYDVVGNLNQIEDSIRGVTSYRYDPVGQLLSSIQPDLTELFAFDPAGNLIDAAPAPAESTGNAYRDGWHQFAAQPLSTSERPDLAPVTLKLLAQYAGCEYQYDEQGNTVAVRPRVAGAANDPGELVLAYDSCNRLTSSVRHDRHSKQVTRYGYDAFGRRAFKQTYETLSASDDGDDAPVASLTFFVWDGDVLLQEISATGTATYVYEPETAVPVARIVSPEGRNSFPASSVHCADVEDWRLPQMGGDAIEHTKAWRAYLREKLETQYRQSCGDRLASAIAASVNDVIYYYHCDHLGTPLDLLDSSGTLVWSVRYRAWGSVFAQKDSAVDQPLRFQGQYADKETGFHYNRHRYYDPQAGRYLTQDPVRLQGGTNLYRYAPNPVGWVDPLGLTCKAYRVIRPDEDPAAGLFPKDPAATYKPEGHVLHGSRPGFASQFISATKSLAVAQTWAAQTGNRIVEIDLDQVNGSVIDVSGDCSPLKGRTAKAWANKSQEVLILGNVPPSALRVL
ncbi:DUF4150 domain-containing protein [Massilia sp. DJPM01]|uniref:RHS repeat-associated core domain-containing protein n=1 Tax=Massilia sp. DJPM01 TaxID=3024404 RepID=UPI00259FD0AD|nr:RHS repeat-associated core domain-containing protein [Massilia sp. DJPM01]MDM5179742.1 DUF4150 domain-containing protein [Massilia sp. DJPM01]